MLPDQSLNRTTLRSSLVKFADTLNSDFVFKSQSAYTNHLLIRYNDESYIAPPFKNIDLQQYKSANKSATDLLIDRIITKLDEVQLIDLQSTLLLWWNFAVIVAILFNFYEIPIAIFLTEQVYKDEFETTTGIVINSVFITILLVDLIFVRPNIAFYITGRITKSHWQTYKKYLKMQFWLDLIAWITLFAYALANNHNFIYLKVLFYLYVVTLSRIDRQIAGKIQLLRLRFAFYKLMKLIFVLLFIVLWLSCIYFAIDYSYYLQQKQYYPVNLWLTNSQCSQYQGGQNFIDLIEMYSWYVWLNYAFYWTLQSISMVGYGDMTPRNPPQVAYCDVVVLLMTLMYAFFINSVWQIIAQASQTADEQQYKQSYLMKYQKNYGVNRKTMNKLGSYMYQMWKLGKSQEIQQQISQSLTQDLRNQLLLTKQKKFFWGIGFFDDLSQASQDNIQLFREWSYLIKQLKYGEDEIIFTQQNIPTRIYSILIGEVKLEYPKSTVSCKCLQGTTFGLQKFFTQEKYGYECKSLRFSKISYLGKDDFQSVLKLYPNTYQKYIQTLEEIKIYRRFQSTGQPCWVCSSSSHPVIRCPDFFQFFEDILQSAEIKLQKIIDRQEEQNRAMFRKNQEPPNSHFHTISRRYFKNSRRSIARKKIRAEKIFQKQKILPQILIDSVKYYHHYRKNGNI